MSALWESVGIIVLPGEHTAEAVAAALPVASQVLERGPRRLALAATIHEGDANSRNETRYAVFVADGNTFVAPPGGVTMHTGESHWQRALAEAFGKAHWFAAYFAAPDVRVFEAGQPSPPLSLPGEWADEDAVLDALATFLGVPDARGILSVPGGESAVMAAAMGRF